MIDFLMQYENPCLFIGMWNLYSNVIINTVIFKSIVWPIVFICFICSLSYFVYFSALAGFE